MGVLAKEGIDAGVPRQKALEIATSAIMGNVKDPLLAIGASLGLAWLESGFPTIDLAPTLTASLACTAIPKSVLEDVKPPWRCFSIRVPAGVLGDKAEETIVLFSHDGTVKTFTINDRALSIGVEPSLAEYADIEITGTTLNHDVSKEMEEWMQHSSKIHGRILCGVCIEMDTPHLSEAIARGPTRSPGVDKRGKPTRWIFELSRPVKVDLRQAVRSYMSGTGKGKLALQCLVRGHHKQQPYGPGSKSRKWIHVEPYWRGDEDSPIALRTHELGKKGK